MNLTFVFLWSVCCKHSDCLDMKKKLYKCHIIIKKNYPCLESFSSSEELKFHSGHTCFHNEEETLKCQEFNHLYCIEKLKTKINNPILFPCYDCKKNHDSNFKLDYHLKHTCRKIYLFNDRVHCITFFKTGKCKCSTKIERHQRKDSRKVCCRFCYSC